MKDKFFQEVAGWVVVGIFIFLVFSALMNFAGGF